MAELVDIVESLRSDNNEEKRKALADAEAYLDGDELDPNAVPDLVDALLPCLKSSNLKFVQGALGLLITLVEIMGEDLAPYIAGVWSPLVERLGDAKVPNRCRRS
jgi:hypothetical protein